ncbi:unnamed protein product [Dicrocoelium dendriticum]|nr:unnamed protein product [Dicrocoelium dendriticum]
MSTSVFDEMLRFSFSLVDVSVRTARVRLTGNANSSAGSLQRISVVNRLSEQALWCQSGGSGLPRSSKYFGGSLLGRGELSPGRRSPYKKPQMSVPQHCDVADVTPLTKVTASYLSI